MNNVVAFHKNDPAPPKFETDGLAALQLNFFLGITVFGVLPQVAAVAYYGALLAGILTISVLAGIGSGFAIKRFFPYRPQMLELNPSTRLRSMAETLKKAA
jgi:hypothetical protein